MMPINQDTLIQAVRVAGLCSFDAVQEFPDDIRKITAALSSNGFSLADADIATLWEEVSSSDGAGWLGTAQLDPNAIVERIGSIARVLLAPR